MAVGRRRYSFFPPSSLLFTTLPLNFFLSLSLFLSTPRARNGVSLPLFLCPAVQEGEKKKLRFLSLSFPRPGVCSEPHVLSMGERTLADGGVPGRAFVMAQYVYGSGPPCGA